MTEPYVVVCDSHEDEAGWLAARQLGIGASDMPVILGLSPWRSILELYAEKTGEDEPEDLSGNEFAEWGHRLEGPIIDAFRERTGRPTQRAGQLIRSVEYPWAQCTLDGLTGAKDHPLKDTGAQCAWPLQVKNTTAWKADDWADGPPEIYVIQEHHEMLVTGADKATIACLLGGNKLVWADIPRDETLIRKIVFRGQEFWHRVLNREPPPPDGSEATKKALGRLHPQDDGTIVELPGELREAIGLLQRFKAEKKVAETEIWAIENAIKAALGDHQAGCFAGGGPTVSWKQQTRAERVVKESTFRVLRIKK